MQIGMIDDANQSAQQDKATIVAVRGGDAERYRELVERHERRVFAVAWSRLGDGALAEEATQPSRQHATSIRPMQEIVFLISESTVKGVREQSAT